MQDALQTHVKKIYAKTWYISKYIHIVVLHTQKCVFSPSTAHYITNIQIGIVLPIDSLFTAV